MTAPSAQASSSDRLPLVLLVDRDADTRQMYAEFLRIGSCQVDEAEDGREALAKAISRKPDVIVSETRLPGIDGFDLCRLLRHDEATCDIPIVFVTGDAYQTQMSRALKAGADAVLIKPCLPEQLAEEIRRVLSHSREQRARVEHVRDDIGTELVRSKGLIEQSNATVHHVALSHAHRRHETVTPPALPPTLVCPLCDQPLNYVRSHIGGVSERHREQWDYFECAAGCGEFQYRQRTRKLRRVA